ncbi:alpha/beta fold hydrolase [Desulforhopalus singaporensis]|uniref:Pimeloyl-ACP methyl ester carboxylesterase n=1 Tax=Desulforhopalus singaporensis TaxID=91360 RepID=A0A1H0NX96_9BACT|nr:alpha/beta fold hydrolase [Desulforhopalus singaporensis]SDO97000.1 Pimeloyl-ACP methyl ester carboxylesterase [Desulforhopalus singaporensis]
MKLASQIVGEGAPVVIIHGLYGMSDNWLPIARKLGESGYCVHLPDMRNHGDSPHADSHTYPDMCSDMLEYFNDHDLAGVHLAGHSMGGKAAMHFALAHPGLLKSLVIVDIAPSAYPAGGYIFHLNIIKSLQSIPLATTVGRGQIITQLQQKLGDRRLAMFLAKNIVSPPSGGPYRLKCNLKVLLDDLPHLFTGLERMQSFGPTPVATLFVKGNDSDYYQAKHDADRHRFFKRSRVTGIDGAGHWLHSERPEEFLKAVIPFLANPESGPWS